MKLCGIMEKDTIELTTNNFTAIYFKLDTQFLT